MRRSTRRSTRAVRLIVAGLLTTAGFTAAAPAHAAGEQVNVWLTTTNDAGGRNVTRGLQQQTPFAFRRAAAAAAQTITVNENTTLPAVQGRRRVVHRHRRLADEQQRRALRGHPRPGDAEAVRPDQTASAWPSSATRWAPPTWPGSATPTTTSGRAT